MNKDDLALAIGTAFLDTITKMQEEEKDFGRSIIVPVMLPLISDEPDWYSAIEVLMPRYTRRTIDELGEVRFESITMAEAYEWKP